MRLECLGGISTDDALVSACCMTSEKSVIGVSRPLKTASITATWLLGLPQLALLLVAFWPTSVMMILRLLQSYEQLAWYVKP